MKKLVTKLMGLILVITSIFGVLPTANAQSLQDTLYQDDAYKFWVAIYVRDGSHMVATQESMIRRSSDNAPVYCVQAHVQFNSGSSVTGIADENQMASLTNLSQEQINRIRLIAYYGYGYEGHTSPEWYYATQLMIWNITNPGYVWAIADNDQTLTPSNRYDAYYNEINSLVDNHKTTPSFNRQKVEMKGGDTITLTDTNGVLSKYYENYEDDHIKAEVQGNNLVVTAKTSYEGRITLNVKENTNEPLLYEGANQYCMSAGDPDMNIAMLELYATQDTTITKVYGADKDGIYQPEEGAVFEVYNADTNELVETVTTDKDGKFTLTTGYGTYRIHQIKGQEGYDFVKDYTFTVDGSTDKANVYFKNEYITSDLEFTKTDFVTGEALPNTTIEIYNADTNELVFTGVTDEDGQIIIKGLGYGKYYILEKNAPEGYELNPERMYFEVTESGKVIKVKMTDEKIKEVSSYSVPDTVTSNTGDIVVAGVIIVLCVGGFVVANKIKNKDKK